MPSTKYIPRYRAINKPEPKPKHPRILCGYELEDGQDFLIYKPTRVRIIAYGHATVMAPEDGDFDVEANGVDFDDWDEEVVDVEQNEAYWEYRDIDKEYLEFDFDKWLKEHVKKCSKCRSMMNPWEYPRPKNERKITEWMDDV